MPDRHYFVGWDGREPPGPEAAREFARRLWQALHSRAGAREVRCGERGCSFSFVTSSNDPTLIHAAMREHLREDHDYES